MSSRLPIGLGARALCHRPVRKPCIHIQFITTNARSTGSSSRSIPWPVQPSTVGCSVRSSTLSLLPRSFRSDPGPSSLQFLRRAFTTSRSTSIRQTYFRRSSGGEGPNNSFWRRWKIYIDELPPIAIVRILLSRPSSRCGGILTAVQIYGLIGVNVGIFLLWQFAYESYVSPLIDSDETRTDRTSESFSGSELAQLYAENFVLSERNIMDGRM